MGVGQFGMSTTESDVSVLFPVGATLDRFETFSDATTTGTFTVRVNGTDTSVTCSLSASQRCSDTTHTTTISAGQTLSIHVTAVAGAKPTSWRLRVR
jgi:hypothetical protein